MAHHAGNSVEMAPMATATDATDGTAEKVNRCDKEHVHLDESVKTFVYIIGGITALSGLIFGYDIGGSGGTYVMDGFRKHFDWVLLEDDDQDDPNYKEESWITAAFSLGAMFGALPSGYVTDGRGRRPALMLYSLVFIVGAIIQFIAVDLSMLYVGRFIGGLGVGGLSMVSPMYQAEMAPEKVRGMLVTLNQLFITFGILLAAALNIGFNEWSQGWRFSYGLNGFFAAALFLLMIVLPETPRWLVQNGRPEEARVVLGRTHHSYEVEATARKIEAAIAEESDIDAGKWKELWSTKHRMRARSWAAIGALLLQQFSGINAVMYFAPSIFKDFFGASASLIVNLCLMTVNFLATFLALALVERLGRRFLLVTGAIGMCVNAGIIGLLASPPFDYKDHQYMAYLIILFTMAYIVCFAYSWGPVAWLIPPEVFPLHLRGKGMTLSTAANWASNTVIGFITPYMLHNLDTWGTFLVFCVLTFVAYLFAAQNIPETRGTDLEDIEVVFKQLANVSPPKRFCMFSMEPITQSMAVHSKVVHEIEQTEAVEGGTASGAYGEDSTEGIRARRSTTVESKHADDSPM